MRILIDQSNPGWLLSQFVEDLAFTFSVANVSPSHTQAVDQLLIRKALDVEHQSACSTASNPRKGSASRSRLICSSVKAVALVS